MNVARFGKYFCLSKFPVVHTCVRFILLGFRTCAFITIISIERHWFENYTWLPIVIPIYQDFHISDVLRCLKELVICAWVHGSTISRNVSGICCSVEKNFILYSTNLFELSPSSSVCTWYWLNHWCAAIRVCVCAAPESFLAHLTYATHQNERHFLELLM